MESLSEDLLRVVARFAGACDAAIRLAPASSRYAAALRADWTRTFPDTASPAAACGADLWGRGCFLTTASSIVTQCAARFRARDDGDAVRAVLARGVKVTVGDGAIAFSRGTSALIAGVCGIDDDAPPLRVLRPAQFAADGARAVALTRSQPSRGLEVRWLPDASDRGGRRAWRSAYLSFRDEPVGLGFRRTGGHGGRAVAALYRENDDETDLLRADVDFRARDGAPATARCPAGKGRAFAVALLGDSAAGSWPRAAVAYARRVDVVSVADGGLLATLPGAHGGAAADGGDALVAWAYTGRAVVAVWRHATRRAEKIRRVDARQLRVAACALRRDVVFVLRSDGALTAYRSLGSAPPLELHRFTGGLAAAPTLTLAPRSRPALLVHTGGAREDLWEVGLPS